MDSIELLEGKDPTPLCECLPGPSGRGIRMFDDVIRFEGKKIKPTFRSEAKLLCDKFKMGSYGNKLTLVNHAGSSISMLSPLTVQSHPMYVGKFFLFIYLISQKINLMIYRPR